MTLPANTPRLRVSDLSLSWNGQPVCADISFTVAAGELVCLVGRSGSGKTTLFHAIAGLTQPDSGQVLLNGQDVTGQSGRISYMLQKDLLLPERTILDNVSLPLRVRHIPRKQAHEQARQHFAAFGLQGAENLYPAQLSGGMRQRAALLRTYLMDNPVILMDEPFSALDALTRQDMRRWFLDMLTELDLSSVLVTHDVDEAVALADRILVLASNVLGAPSRIVEDIPVPAPRAEREQFVLTPHALEVKKRVLALLD